MSHPHNSSDQGPPTKPLGISIRRMAVAAGPEVRATFAWEDDFDENGHVKQEWLDKRWVEKVALRKSRGLPPQEPDWPIS